MYLSQLLTEVVSFFSAKEPRNEAVDESPKPFDNFRDVLATIDLRVSDSFNTRDYSTYCTYVDQLTAKGYKSHGNIALKEEEKISSWSEKQEELYSQIPSSAAKEFSKLELEVLEHVLSGHRIIITSAFTTFGKYDSNAVKLWYHTQNILYSQPKIVERGLEAAARADRLAARPSYTRQDEIFELSTALEALELAQNKGKKRILYKRTTEKKLTEDDISVILKFHPSLIVTREDFRRNQSVVLNALAQETERSVNVFDFYFPTSLELSQLIGRVINSSGPVSESMLKLVLSNSEEEVQPSGIGKPSLKVVN